MVNYTCHSSELGHTFDAIKVSFRGAERQRKSHLQLSAMFSSLIDAKRVQNPELFAGLSAEAAKEKALEVCINEYNEFGEVANQPKFQLRDDDLQTIKNLTFYVADPVKELMRKHLDAHKGALSGGLTVFCCCFASW